MNRLNKGDKSHLKLIFEYHKIFVDKPLSTFIIIIILIYKFIGIIASTHLLDRSSNNKKYNISNILRFTTYCYSSDISCITKSNYDVLCSVIYLVVLILIMVGVIIYINKKYKVQSFLAMLFLLLLFGIAVFNSYLNEILSIVIISYFPFNKESESLKAISIFISKLTFPRYFLLVGNIIIILAINVITYYFICITNTPLFLSKTPFSILSNNKGFKILLVIITSNFQIFELIDVFYINSNSAKLYMNIISLLFIFFLLCSIKSYYFQSFSISTSLFKFLIYSCICSGIISFVNYSQYKEGMKTIELTEKILFEILFSVLIIIIEWRIFTNQMTKDFSENIFIKQKDYKKCEWSFFFFYELILRLEKNNKAYQRILNVIYEHCSKCKDKTCPCNDNKIINGEIKNTKEMYNKVYDWFDKEFSVLVTNIIKSNKIKTHYQIVLTYCEFIYTIKHGCIKSSYYLEKYFKKIKSLPFDLKYCLYTLKKTIKSENILRLKELSSKDNKYFTIWNNLNFIKYQKVISDIKDCLYENSDNLQKVIMLKKINFNSIIGDGGNLSKVTLSSIYKLCYQFNQGDKKLKDMITSNFSPVNPLTNGELCYLINEYYSMFSSNTNNNNNIPDDIYSYISTSACDNKLLNIHKSFYEKNMIHPLIVSLDDGKNFIIKYICHYLCLKLDYLPSELIESNINILLPEIFHIEHASVVNKTILNRKYNHIEKEIFMIQKKGYYFPCMMSLSYFPTLNRLVSIIANVNVIKPTLYHYYMVLDSYGNFLSYSDSLESAIMINRDIIQKLKFNFFSLFNLGEFTFKGNFKEDEDSIHIKYDINKLRESYMKISEYLKEDKCDMTLINKIGDFTYIPLNFTEEIENKKIINDMIKEKTHNHQKGYVDMNIQLHAIGNIQYYIVEYIETKEMYDNREQNGKYSTLKKKLVMSRNNVHSFTTTTCLTPIRKRFSNSNITTSSQSVGYKNLTVINQSSLNNATLTSSTNQVILPTTNNNNLLKKINSGSENNQIPSSSPLQQKKFNSFIGLIEMTNNISASLNSLTIKDNYIAWIIFYFFLLGIAILIIIECILLNKELQNSERLFKLNIYTLEINYNLLFTANVYYDSCLVFQGKNNYDIQTNIDHLEITRDELAEISENKANELIETLSKLIKQLTIQNDITLQLYLQSERYLVLNQDWTESEADTTLYEEMSLFHNYLKLLTYYKSGFGFCNHEYYLYGKLDEGVTPNYNDKMISYLTTNLFTKMVTKLHRILLILNQEYEKSHNKIINNTVIINIVAVIAFIGIFISIKEIIRVYIRNSYELAKKLIFENNPFFDVSYRPTIQSEGENEIENKIEMFKQIIRNFEIVVLQNQNINFNTMNYTITSKMIVNSNLDSKIFNSSPPNLIKKKSFQNIPKKHVSSMSNNKLIKVENTTISSMNTGTNATLNTNTNRNYDMMNSKLTKYSEKGNMTNQNPKRKTSITSQTNEHHQKNLYHFLYKLKHSFPLLSLYNILMWSSMSLFLLLTAAHLIITILENKGMIFSSDMIINLCDRIMRYNHLILFYKLSILNKNPDVLQSTESECVNKIISNPYNIKLQRNNSFYDQIGDSEYGCLLTQAEIDQDNIDELVMKSKKVNTFISNFILNDYIKIESQLDTSNFCISLSRFYYHTFYHTINSSEITLKDIFSEMNSLSKQCRLIGSYLNKGGLEQSIKILSNNLNSYFLEFYIKNSKKEEIDFDYFITKNNNFLYNNMNFVIIFDKIQTTYFAIALNKMVSAFDKQLLEEYFIIVSTVIVYTLFLVFVSILKKKNSNIYYEIYKVVHKINNIKITF